MASICTLYIVLFSLSYTSLNIINKFEYLVFHCFTTVDVFIIPGSMLPRRAHYI